MVNEWRESWIPHLGGRTRVGVAQAQAPTVCSSSPDTSAFIPCFLTFPSSHGALLLTLYQFSNLYPYGTVPALESSPAFSLRPASGTVASPAQTHCPFSSSQGSLGFSVLNIPVTTQSPQVTLPTFPSVSDTRSSPLPAVL